MYKSIAVAQFANLPVLEEISGALKFGDRIKLAVTMHGRARKSGNKSGVGLRLVTANSNKNALLTLMFNIVLTPNDPLFLEGPH